MSRSSFVSTPTVSARHATLAVGASLTALVMLAAMPFGSMLLTPSGTALMTVLPAVWVAAAAAVDFREWRAYNPARRSVSFVAWTFFGLSLLAPWIG